jgi:rhodanese-related sulfurtransferase
MLETALTRRAAMLGLVSAIAVTARDGKADGVPWPADDQVEPGELAKRLGTGAGQLDILYAGFPVLYRAGHIPGAILAGPVGKPEGLTLFKQKSQDIPRAQEVFVYCGCCPVEHCPNIRPAYQTLKDMGFSKIRVVNMPENFHTNWVAKGYKTAKGEDA